MLLHDCIVSAYAEGFSGIYVYCDNPKAVSKEFLTRFEEAYIEAMDELEEDVDCVCSEKEDDIPCPATIAQIDNEKFLVRLAPLYLSMNDGVRADNDYLPNALDRVLEELSESHPEMSYYGMIAYEWCDEHSADIVSYEINSDPNINFYDVTYPFVENIFAEIFADDGLAEEFWERLADNLDCCDEDTSDEIIECFSMYDAMSDEVLQKIGEILGECDFDY